MIYDVPPPPPAEIVYVDRPVLVFSDPVFDFVPPPPIVFLAPPPAYLVFPPPPPPVELFVLPVPVFVPVPVGINPPAYVAAPPENVIFNNIHNTTIINNVPTSSIRRRPAGVGAAGVAAGVAAGAAAGAIAAKVALPPSVARKAAIIGGQGAPGPNPGQPGPGAPAGAAGTQRQARAPCRLATNCRARLASPCRQGQAQSRGRHLPVQPAHAAAARLPPGHELPGAAMASRVTAGARAPKPGTPLASRARAAVQPRLATGPGTARRERPALAGSASEAAGHSAAEQATRGSWVAQRPGASPRDRREPRPKGREASPGHAPRCDLRQRGSNHRTDRPQASFAPKNRLAPSGVNGRPRLPGLAPP